MRHMTFEAGTNSCGTMEKITGGKPLMAVDAEDVCRNHETGISRLVMAVVTALFSKRRVRGILLNCQKLLLLGR
jgi:hypothetical protein